MINSQQTQNTLAFIIRRLEAMETQRLQTIVPVPERDITGSGGEESEYNFRMKRFMFETASVLSSSPRASTLDLTSIGRAASPNPDDSLGDEVGASNEKSIQREEAWNNTGSVIRGTFLDDKIQISEKARDLHLSRGLARVAATGDLRTHSHQQSRSLSPESVVVQKAVEEVHGRWDKRRSRSLSGELAREIRRFLGKYAEEKADSVIDSSSPHFPLSNKIGGASSSRNGTTSKKHLGKEGRPVLKIGKFNPVTPLITVRLTLSSSCEVLVSSRYP